MKLSLVNARSLEPGEEIAYIKCTLTLHDEQDRIRGCSYCREMRPVGSWSMTDFFDISAGWDFLNVPTFARRVRLAWECSGILSS